MYFNTFVCCLLSFTLNICDAQKHDINTHNVQNILIAQITIYNYQITIYNYQIIIKVQIIIYTYVTVVQFSSVTCQLLKS